MQSRDTKASSTVSDSQQLQWSSPWDVFVYQQQMENATGTLNTGKLGFLQGESPKSTQSNIQRDIEIL